MANSLRQQVWERSGGFCEYCRVPEAHDPRPFHLDHVRPQKHDGPTVLENLAMSCASCSLYKGPNLAGYDPESDIMQPLFNPRTQDWNDHFASDGAELKGLTPTGRTTARVLRFNEPLRVQHRELLIELGVLPM